MGMMLMKITTIHNYQLVIFLETHHLDYIVLLKLL